MMKVVIADDEQMICSMIIKMIPWKELGLEVAGTADNGYETLRLVGEYHPDIVITDIRMPGIDGLEMIRQAMDIAPQTEFVIISGYKNFEYAHQALTMGVRHYLLKPIDAAELNGVLERIIREHSQNEESRDVSEALAAERENYRKSARRHFLNSILQETSIDAPDKSGEQTEELDFRNNRYLAFFAKVDWTQEGEIAPGILDILQEVIEREEQEWGCEYVNSHVRSGVISVINYPEGAKEAHPEDIETLYTKCRREMDKFSGYTVTIGIGTEKRTISEVRESIDEAVSSVKCRIRRGLGRLIFFDRLKYEMPEQELFTQDLKRGNARAIEALDAEALKSDLQEIREQLHKNSRYSPLFIFELIESFRNLILEVWQENQVAEEIKSSFILDTENLMDRCTTEAQMAQQFEDTIDRCFRRILAERRQSGQAPVRAAKAYLLRHYMDNPSLEEVAEAVSMSPAYMSTLFKKELGIGFSEYLIQLRCEEAKRLMRETDEPMAVIAEKVGYQDAKYFSRIFRKTVGIKPSEYRKIYR